jgi:hypothetical protein
MEHAMNSTASSDELRDFHRFIGDKVSSGGSSQSPEEVLDEWRLLHPDLLARAEDIAAIQEAIDDLENGESGSPFADFDRSFRARRGIPPRS